MKTIYVVFALQLLPSTKASPFDVEREPHISSSKANTVQSLLNATHVVDQDDSRKLYAPPTFYYFNMQCQTEGAFVNQATGGSGSALDSIKYFSCSSGEILDPNAGGDGGNPWEVSDADGFYGFKSGNWRDAPYAAAGLSFQKAYDKSYIGPFGSSYEFVTEMVCSGGSKMCGIAGAYAKIGGYHSRTFLVARKDLRPICTILKFECPGSSYITTINLNSGGGVDDIVSFVCSDSQTPVPVNVTGSGSGAGIVKGGPFIGLKSGVYNSASSNALAGLAFKKLDGSFTKSFGSDVYNGVTTEQLCPIAGEVIKGFRLPQVFLTSGYIGAYTHLVGSGLAIICGCADAGACTTPSPSTTSPTGAPTKTKKPTAAPTSTAVPTQGPTSTTAPTAVFCTATRCKNGGSCNTGDSTCTCLSGFSGKTCTTTASPTPSPTSST